MVNCVNLPWSRLININWHLKVSIDHRLTSIKELQSPLQGMANLAPLDSCEYEEQLLKFSGFYDPPRPPYRPLFHCYFWRVNDAPLIALGMSLAWHHSGYLDTAYTLPPSYLTAGLIMVNLKGRLPLIARPLYKIETWNFQELFLTFTATQRYQICKGDCNSLTSINLQC